jgi:serine/threonine-protein kinase
MDKEVYRTSSKKASKTATLIGIFGIIVFIIVVAVFMWDLMLRDIFASRPRDPILITNFVGRRFDDVRMDRAYDDRFNFTEPTRIHSNEHAEGIIISQNPPAGSSRIPPAEGARIDIEFTVSLGEQQPGVMPYLINIDIGQAQRMLRELDTTLRLELYPIEDDAVTRGFVIDTSPAAGAPIPGGSTIIIRYSAGPEIRMVEIPDFEGRTIEELEAEFNMRLLVPQITFFYNDSPPGTVIFVAGAGTEVLIYTSVAVHVSRGPEELPPEPPEEPPPNDGGVVIDDDDDPPPQIPIDPGPPPDDWWHSPPDDDPPDEP